MQQHRVRTGQTSHRRRSQYVGLWVAGSMVIAACANDQGVARPVDLPASTTGASDETNETGMSTTSVTDREPTEPEPIVTTEQAVVAEEPEPAVAAVDTTIVCDVADVERAAREQIPSEVAAWDVDVVFNDVVLNGGACPQGAATTVAVAVLSPGPLAAMFESVDGRWVFKRAYVRPIGWPAEDIDPIGYEAAAEWFSINVLGEDVDVAAPAATNPVRREVSIPANGPYHHVDFCGVVDADALEAMTGALGYVLRPGADEATMAELETYDGFFPTVGQCELLLPGDWVMIISAVDLFDAGTARSESDGFSDFAGVSPRFSAEELGLPTGDNWAIRNNSELLGNVGKYRMGCGFVEEVDAGWGLDREPRPFDDFRLDACTRGLASLLSHLDIS